HTEASMFSSSVPLRVLHASAVAVLFLAACGPTPPDPVDAGDEAVGDAGEVRSDAGDASPDAGDESIAVPAGQIVGTVSWVDGSGATGPATGARVGVEGATLATTAGEDGAFT